MNPALHFSGSYAQARSRFLEAAAQGGLAVESTLHPETGCDGEELALDVVRDGPADAEHLLIVSSACHGVEGYCGNGVQVAALTDPAWRAHARAHKVAVLYLHALNPYGFSHLRRTTHENIDLNRNFLNFSQPLPVNPAYREVHPLLVPEAWPPSPENEAAIAAFVAERGLAAYQAAISGGQREFADGLFYGGRAPSWSNLTLREVLRAHGRKAQRIAWIDIHTGLGPSGVGERIFAGPDDALAIGRARAWWGGAGATPVTSIYDGSSTSAFLTGLMWNALPQECPQAQYTGLALEFGTEPIMAVLQALRADQWLQAHPQAPAPLARAIKKQVLAAFYTDTEAWKSEVLRQSRQALCQAVDGLAGEPAPAA